MSPLADQLIKVQVLGPVEVLVGNELIRLSRLQRHLIAVLALEPGLVVSVDVLAESLWGDDQPRDARNRIQALVASLRQRLDEGAVITRAPGYCLSTELVSCDAALTSSP